MVWNDSRDGIGQSCARDETFENAVKLNDE